MTYTVKDLQKFKAMFELSPVGCVIIGRDGIVNAVNSAAAEILGCGCSELLGSRFVQFVPDSAQLFFSGFLEKVLSVGQKAVCEINFTKGGNLSILRFEGSSDVFGNGCYIVIIDITGCSPFGKTPAEFKGDSELDIYKQEISDLNNKNQLLSIELSRYRENDKKLADSHTRKQKNSAQLLKAWEEERTLFAREINEELGQMLAALQLKVSLIAMEYRDHEHLVAKTTEMEKMIVTSINSVRRISSEIRPVMLDVLGLAEAIEWQVKEFRKVRRIPCNLSIRLSRKKIGRDVSSIVFRILKDALNYISNHSGTTHVQVDLVERMTYLTLSVRDDGRSVDEKETINIQSIFISRLQEQVDVLGGKLRVCDSPRYGAALFARIPFAGKESRHANQDTDSR